MTLTKEDVKKIQPMWSQGSWFLKIFSSQDLNEADVLLEFRRPILEKIQSIFGSVLVAEAKVATSKAFIGPPEVRGRGHSGLSEDITDQALTGPLSLCNVLEYFNYIFCYRLL